MGTNMTPSTSDPEEYSDDDFIIGFANVHGIKSRRTPLAVSLHDTIAAMTSARLSVLGISEHQLSLKDPHVAQTIHQFARIRRQKYPTICQFNSSDETSAGNGRLMGGTAIMATGDIIGRLTPNGSGGDAMGRWSCIHLKRHQQPPLSIISVYQVCQSPTNKVGSTAWHQQRRALDRENRTAIRPRTAFLEDLTKFIRSLQAREHDIIVGGDWNDHIGAPNSTVLRLSTTLNLADPWLQHHPDCPNFPTYERGSHRIDCALVSHRLLQSVCAIAYSPVGFLSNSDHRTIFLKMSRQQVFRNKIGATPTVPRHVRSNDKQSVTTYIDTMFAHLQEHNVFNRAAKLMEAESPSRLVESIDVIIGQAGDLGEKRCRRRRPEWYSIQLVKQRLTVSYLRHYVNGLKCGLNRSEVILSRLEAIDATITTLPLSLSSAQAMLNEHITKLKASNPRELRTQHLTSVGTIHGHKINKHEIALSTWRTVAYLKGATTISSLTQIDIPSDWPPPFQNVASPQSLSDPKLATQWTTIHSPDEIEFYLQVRNRFHFGQAQCTPFNQPPLSTSIPWGADSAISTDILTGTYIPSSTISDLCTRVLSQCKRTHPQDAISPIITLESFKCKIRKWRESTTTSPSGRHLGRYKALFAKGIHDSSDIESADAFAAKQKAIAKVILTIINFCIQTGHVLDRWKTVVNTMIFKEPAGDFRIHRLRVLHIYEADLNLIMAVKWRDLLKAADSRGTVNINQHGARPGCEAASLALCEEFRTDIAYSTRRSLISVDNDAASCFDRMLPPLVSLTTQAYGLPCELAKLHGATLRAMKYHLRTTNGISSTFYSHSDAFPIFGTGQGSGNSPVLWLLPSATLFDVHTSLAWGAELQDPQRTITVKVSISGFVDDTNACVNEWHPQRDGRLPELMAKVQSDAQLWNDLLHVSGGKLELNKCSYHPLSFSFDPDGTPRVNATPPPALEIVDSESQRIIHVPPFSPYSPHKTLGHWKAPAGAAVAQLSVLRTKMKTISIRIATSWLSRYGARLAYHAIYVATLRYVLPQCHFPATTLRKAEKQSLPSLYAKCGFSRKTPQALLFAPLEYGSGGFIHWDTLQGEGQILHFLKHWRTNTVISSTLRINLSWCQWQAGTSQSILNQTAPIVYLEARWIASFRDALHRFGATVVTDDSFIPRPECEEDKYLMDVVIQSKQFSETEIRIINYCRLYLHLTTVSEMFDANRNTLMEHIVKCHRAPWFDPTLNVAIQRRPSDYQIRTKWQRRVCNLVKASSPPTGQWILPLRLRRETYSIPGDGTSRLYHWYAGSYWECSPARVVDSNLRLTLLRPSAWTPATSSDAPVQIHARVHLTIYTTIPSQRSMPHPVRTPNPSLLQFHDHIATLDTWAQTLLRYITWIQPFDYVCNALEHTSPELPALVVSDGSAIEGQHMSYGVTIGLMDGRILVELMGPASGPPSSHRAECTGCLAGAVFCAELTRFAQRDFSSLTIRAVSDNQGMIRSLTDRISYDKVYPNSTLRPDWDLLEEIVVQYRSIHPRSLSFQWEKGHQDSIGSERDLSPEAMLNIRADSLAANYTTLHGMNLAPVTPLYPTTRCTLFIHGVAIHSNYRHNLRMSEAEPHLFTYLCSQHGWSDSVCDDVDWDALCMAAQTYESTEVHLLKLIHDKLPLRKQVGRHQTWTQAQCHYCETHDTFDHLQCGQCNPASIRFRDDIRKSVWEYLTHRQCPTTFTRQFMVALEHWLSSALPPPDGTSAQWDGQAAVGWRLLTRGFLTRQWHQLLHTSRTSHSDPSCPPIPYSEIT